MVDAGQMQMKNEQSIMNLKMQYSEFRASCKSNKLQMNELLNDLGELIRDFPRVALLCYVGFFFWDYCGSLLKSD